jgi:hypothetical protein
MSVPGFRPALRIVFTLLALVCSLAANAQEVPTVSFGFSFPGSEPERYEIVVPLQGEATYASDGKLTANSDSDDFKAAFPLSEAARGRIFDLAKRTGYFQGELDSKKKVASTGAKTLKYKDEQKSTTQTYNYSTIAAVQQLTQLFQDLSTTMEFGRRLDYYHRYQKLALDEELKRMEDMQRDNSLAEVAAVAPILNEIVTDSTLINPVRARAQRILAKAGIAPPQ